MVDFARVAGGTLAGLGDGLIEQARMKREEAQRALAAQQRQAERLQDRKWQVEDRNMSLASRRGGGGRSSGGNASGSGTTPADSGFSFAYDPNDPSAVRTIKIRAQAKAMQEGRTEITPDDYLWAENSGNEVSPEARARLVQTEAAAIRDSSSSLDMSQEEIMQQAATTVDNLLAPPQAQQEPQTGFGALQPATLPLPTGLGSPGPIESGNNVALPAPRDPGQRQVGQVYRSPTGQAARWTEDGWEVVDG